MGKILYYDYCALIILVILLVTTVYRGLYKTRSQRIYIEIVVVGILSAIADVLAVRLDQMGAGHVVWKHIAHSSYLILHNMSTPIYMMYLIVLSDTDHKLQRVQRILFSAPFAVMFITTITNPIHNQLFCFDEFDNYTRGNVFGILYFTAIFYVLFGIIHLARHKINYARDQFIALCCVFPIMLGAMVIQFFYPQLLCEMLANAIGLLLISTMLQRPEEYIDTLSGLGKESAYASSMERIFANEKPSAVVMLNVNNFTSLHSMLGYSRVVKLTRSISEKLEMINKKEKFKAELFYLGGGKFRLVLDHRHAGKVEALAERVNEVLASGVQLDEMNIHLVAVVCILECGKDVNDMESMIVFGNELAREEYTGKVLKASEIYQKKHYDLIRDMDEVIERALAKNNFEVYYQPIYSVKEGRYNSAEALLRLKDETYGFVRPDLFIAAAEKSGRIHQIGAFVFEEVCKFIASDEFKLSGLDYIEVNLSVVQCMRNDLTDEILSIMQKYQVQPNQINLEITETAASYSQKVLKDNILTLTEHGIKFSLDDYGTGYSNMRRIASMPFEIIKLDKSFAVSDENPRMRIVLENTIRMIKAMQMKIVVEGIETEMLVKKFSDLECEYIQGYYYSKPIPREDFIAFIAGNQK